MSGMIAIEIDPAGHTVVERRSDQIDALGIGDSRPEPVACVGQQGGIFRIHDKPCFKYLSENLCAAETNPGAGKMEHGLVVLHFLFPTNEISKNPTLKQLPAISSAP